MRMLLGRRPPQPSRHIVLAHPDLPLEQLADAVAAAGAEVLWHLPLVHGLIVSCPGPATCAAVLGIPGVAAVEDGRTALPRPLRPLGAAPAAAPLRRALVAWGVARVGAPWAWTRTRGEGVKVAIIDTGADWTHPSLAPNIHGGVNILAPGEPPDDDHGRGTHVAGIIAGADGGLAPVSWRG
jgi:subtilisin family serine protease